MSDDQITVASIVTFLRSQLSGLSAEARESVETCVESLQNIFGVGPEELEAAVDLRRLMRAARNAPELEAERLKNEGNELMKNDRYEDALQLYSRAIDLHPVGAVYYCNRAAAHYKLGRNEAAVADCTAALALQPDYGKAHGRLGLALAALDRHREARAAFHRASELEPDNPTYSGNVRMADERIAAERPAAELAGLLGSGPLLSMATEMLSDPNMQNLISGLMTQRQEPNAGGIAALLEAGQLLAQQMQAAHPELVDTIRQHVHINVPHNPGGPNGTVANGNATPTADTATPPADPAAPPSGDTPPAPPQ